MNSSESIMALAAALAKAQGAMAGAIKDAINPHLKSKYADLASVVDAVRPALAPHGLSFVQVCHEWDIGAQVETIILHESGEWLSCGKVSVPAMKADAQGFGSALTYARRYGLSAAFGVAPEDDDGHAATKNPPAAKHPYADASITANIGAWRDLVADGKKTADDIIGLIQSKNTLNALQIKRIRDGVEIAQDKEAA